MPRHMFNVFRRFALSEASVTPAEEFCMCAKFVVLVMRLNRSCAAELVLNIAMFVTSSMARRSGLLIRLKASGVNRHTVAWTG
jgi:hypothetical protein